MDPHALGASLACRRQPQHAERSTQQRKADTDQELYPGAFRRNARVTRLLKLNEYKRRQAPIGIRVTHRAFGRDWRYPITSRYTEPVE